MTGGRFEADWVSLHEHLGEWVLGDDAAVDASVTGDEREARACDEDAASHRRRARAAAARLGLSSGLVTCEYEALTAAASAVTSALDPQVSEFPMGWLMPLVADTEEYRPARSRGRGRRP